jgi:hypothetical protein
VSAAYAYDVLGRRKSKTVDSLTTAYLHDGDREIAEGACPRAGRGRTRGTARARFCEDSLPFRRGCETGGIRTATTRPPIL